MNKPNSLEISLAFLAPFADHPTAGHDPLRHVRLSSGAGSYALDRRWKREGQGEPNALWADDGGDQLLLRRRPVCRAGKKPGVHRQSAPTALSLVSLRVWNADASMVMDMSTGPSAALPLSLQVTIRSATDQAPAGVANEGYWGIAVRPKTTYQGSFYAKAYDPAIGPITVSLINDDSAKVLATTTVPAVTSDWSRYTFTLPRRRRSIVEKSSRTNRWQTGKTVVQPGFAFPADLSRPHQRQPHRPDGESGGDEAGLPALPRRKLPRRQLHQ